MATVSLRKVNRVFAEHHAVCDLDLEVADGEFVVVVGPSGCGKTTMLRMIAGLEEISSGEILIDGEVVNDLEPQRRDVAMVFQEYALYPQMTVFDNIAFGLKLRRRPSHEIRRRVSEIAEILDIAELLERKPRALSGGQRQRVAMGRALVRDPKVFLLDEPLSNLDAKLRVHMRYEVARIQRELRTTTVFVTHDQVEAMTMGSRVAVMHAGRLLQVDTPQQLYDQPANVLVAAFIGSPEMNLFRAAIERDGESGLACRVGSQRLRLPEVAARGLSSAGRVVGGEVILGLRPEALEDGSLPIAGDDRARLSGVVEAVEILGAERLAHVRVEGARIVTAEVLETVAPEDERAAERGSRPRDLVVGRFDASSRASAGDAVEIAVDMAKAHVFDPATGLPIDGVRVPA